MNLLFYVVVMAMVNILFEYYEDTYISYIASVVIGCLGLMGLYDEVLKYVKISRVLFVIIAVGLIVMLFEYYEDWSITYLVLNMIMTFGLIELFEEIEKFIDLS